MRADADKVHTYPVQHDNTPYTQGVVTSRDLMEVHLHAFKSIIMNPLVANVINLLLALAIADNIYRFALYLCVSDSHKNCRVEVKHARVVVENNQG